MIDSLIPVYPIPDTGLVCFGEVEGYLNGRKVPVEDLFSFLGESIAGLSIALFFSEMRLYFTRRQALALVDINLDQAATIRELKEGEGSL